MIFSNSCYYKILYRDKYNKNLTKILCKILIKISKSKKKLNILY